MRIHLAALAVVGTAAYLVAAQASPPSCLLPCYSQAIGASSSSCATTNVSCLCHDNSFQAAAIVCFQSTCSNASAIAAAEAYGVQACANVSVSLNTAAIGSATVSAGDASSIGSVVATIGDSNYTAASSAFSSAVAQASVTGGALSTLSSGLSVRASSVTSELSGVRSAASAASASATVKKSSASSNVATGGSLFGAALLAIGAAF
ncbi:hypothetical protein JCM1840_003687 [Sporobolomyces johnsonii]